MIRVVGLDPGLVSGLCSFTIGEEDKAVCVDHWQLDHLGVGQYFERRNSDWGHNDIIVAVESFIITPGTGKKTQAPWSLESIGICRYFVEKAGGSLRMSAPSAHKRLVSDQVLKNAGLWFPGEGHACDAARVALHVCLIDFGLMKWALKGEDD